MEYEELIDKLKSQSNPKDREGMARFGINSEYALGIRVPVLRKLAKEVGKDHTLAQKLWNSKIHEARILASMIDDPKQVTEKQMDEWIKEFNSWDLCDQTCMNLFCQLPMAYRKAIEWTSREKEFERRAGFALMACLAWKDKKADDKKLEQFFFPYIKKYSTDERNFVKRALNWALRQIGKRNLNLNKKAIEIAKEIQKIDSKSAKWIANDAIRELTSETVQKRLQNK
jgi:3-methyladenine DNA glycosylase AlkD